MQALDTLGRPLRSLRISVTDRCNLRCQYCMPEDEYEWIPWEQLLTCEEILALVEVFVELGVEKLRITGGEPLLRRELPTGTAADPGIRKKSAGAKAPSAGRTPCPRTLGTLKPFLMNSMILGKNDPQGTGLVLVPELPNGVVVPCRWI